MVFILVVPQKMIMVFNHLKPNGVLPSPALSQPLVLELLAGCVCLALITQKHRKYVQYAWFCTIFSIFIHSTSVIALSWSGSWEMGHVLGTLGVRQEYTLNEKPIYHMNTLIHT